MNCIDCGLESYASARCKSCWDDRVGYTSQQFLADNKELFENLVCALEYVISKGMIQILDGNDRKAWMDLKKALEAYNESQK